MTLLTSTKKPRGMTSRAASNCNPTEGDQPTMSKKTNRNERCRAERYRTQGTGARA